jgi:hypothetical protein
MTEVKLSTYNKHLDTLIGEIQLISTNKSQFDEQSFDILNKFDHLDQITEDELLKLCMRRDLPAQYYATSEFGYFNVTVFSESGYTLQIYLMNDINTEIHNHPFSGVFRILRGESLHTKYKFKPETEVTEFISTGNLDLIDAKVMTVGSTECIDKDLIHQLARIAKTNISLVITKNLKIKNGFFIGPRLFLKNKILSPNFTRKINALSFIKSDDLNIEISNFLENLDLYELLTLFSRLPFFRKTENDKLHQIMLKEVTKVLNKKGYEEHLKDYKKLLVKQNKKIALLKSKQL